MTILIDTHCFLWMLSEPTRFSRATTEILLAQSSQLLFSTAAAWEIGIKYELGKLQLPEPPKTFVPKKLAELKIQTLDISLDHALFAATLPTLHFDPFDRLMIAQAQLEDLLLLTSDKIISKYKVKVMKP